MAGDGPELEVIEEESSDGMSNRGGARAPRALKSGKSTTSSTRSRSPTKSVRMSRAASGAGSEASGGGGGGRGSAARGPGSGATEVVDENGGVHIDMNNQGLTSIVSTLFERQNVVSLDLGCNNLRSIPPPISKLVTLTRLSITKNSVRCTHSNDYSGLPMEFSQLVHLEDLDVSECNFPHVPPAIWRLPSLKRLNISRNKINMLVPEVGNLIHLRHLNAQLTNISTLPPEIAFCQDLEVLLLFGNVIESLPETLRELPALHTLSINYQSFCAIFDAYMDNLLQKGQIQSEHIPPVVFEIPSLRVLNLEATKINTLPDRCQAHLEEFHLQRNFLTKMPLMVPHITTLKVLDVSNNFLASVPEEVGQLRALEVFMADNNRIDAIPATVGHMTKLTYLSMGGNKISRIPAQLGYLFKLHTLILDRNCIQEIPESITKLKNLQTLDLTSNQIQALPISFYKMTSLVRAHTFDKLTKTGLWLHLNPIKVPPPEIWKTEEPAKIYTYLKKLEIMRTENLQRQKLVLLGNSQCGKTSLAKTMISGKSVRSAAAGGGSSGTRMVEYTSWRTENDVSFMLLDTGGDSVYQLTHPLFLDTTSIYLLVYDHRRYTAQTHHAALGYYLDLLQVHAPGVLVKIVGTQSDYVSPAIRDATLEVVREEVDRQLKEMDANMATEIQKIDAVLKTIGGGQQRPAEILDHLRKQRAKLEELRQRPLRLHGDVRLVSCEEGIPGVLDLVEELEYLAVDKTLRPHAQRFVPESWLKYRRTLKLQHDFCLPWETVVNLGKKHGVWGDALQDCLDFLVETGEILWLKNIPDLRDTIFHNSRKTVEILSGLIRHNLDAFLNYDENKVFVSSGQMAEDSFAEAKHGLQRWGQVSRPMLKCLWFYLRLKYDDFNTLCDLIPKLDLCYKVPQPEIPVRKTEYSQLLVVPWYNRDACLEESQQVAELWPPKSTRAEQLIELGTCFSFPLQYPQGLFERLSCRIQHLVLSRIDWQDLIVAEAEVEESGGGGGDDDHEGFFSSAKLLLKRSLDPDDFTPVVTIAVRSSSRAAAVDLLLKTNRHMCQLLKDFPGMIWYVDFSSANCKGVSVADCMPFDATAA